MGASRAARVHVTLPCALPSHENLPVCLPAARARGERQRLGRPGGGSRRFSRPGAELPPGACAFSLCGSRSSTRTRPRGARPSVRPASGCGAQCARVGGVGSPAHGRPAELPLGTAGAASGRTREGRPAHARSAAAPVSHAPRHAPRPLLWLSRVTTGSTLLGPPPLGDRLPP